MKHEFEIKPQYKINIGIKELWEYKELFYFFTWRDVKVKYKQTILGFLWAVIQPLFFVVVFALFLGDSISQKADLPIPYILYALSGMLIWAVFSSGMSNAANSMVNNANIIKKIYFPRLIIPISSVFVALIDFFVTLIVFLFLVIYYRVDLNVGGFVYIPISLLLTCLTSIGMGTFLAALNIKYRDVRYIIPFLVQGLLFLTPVLYPITISSNRFIQILMEINPMSGPLELIRATFNLYKINYETLLISFFSSIILFVLGVYYFRKTESYFADLA